MKFTKGFFLFTLLGVASGFAPIACRRNDASTSLQMKSRNAAMEALPKFLAGGMIAASALLGPINLNENHQPIVPVASAFDSRVIGELKGSGLVFKVRSCCAVWVMQKYIRDSHKVHDLTFIFVLMIQS